MNDDWFYITTIVSESTSRRSSLVLKADGTPFELEKRKEPIGFVLKPTK
jgi:hypothetical protein